MMWDDLPAIFQEKKDSFQAYFDLLQHWNKKIGLVQERTLPEFWQRHLIDSAQLASYIPQSTSSILDIGSGAGFPGIVLSILEYPQVHLCEIQYKKVIFLKEVIRHLNLNAIVLNQSIWTVDLPIKTFTSRAFSSLKNLLEVMLSVSRETPPVGYFHKGEQFMQEIEEAKGFFEFDVEVFTSQTNFKSVILKIENIYRKIN